MSTKWRKLNSGCTQQLQYNTQKCKLDGWTKSKQEMTLKQGKK